MLYLEACYKAGKKELAEKVRQSLRKDMEQQKKYYLAMNGGNTPDISPAGADNNDPMFRSMLMEYRINEAMMIVLEELEKKYAPETLTKQPTTENPGQTVTNTAKPDTAAVKDTNK